MISVPSEIKELYHQDHCYKNIRIHFPNGERADVCNDLIVKDSANFTESLCSQNTLKFGLCEASIFECETVGVGNIKGAVAEIFCEIECPSVVEGATWRADLQKYVYPISYGTFIINESKRQADMIHRKIVAYNVLSAFDFKFTKYQLYRAVYPNSALSDYAQQLIPLISENLQTDAFGCERTEISQYTDFYADRFSRQQYAMTHKLRGLRLTPSNSVKFYCVEIEGEVPDDVQVLFGRFYNPSTYPPSGQGGVLVYYEYPADRFRYSYRKNGWFIYPNMSMSATSDKNSYYITSSSKNEGAYIAVVYGELGISGTGTTSRNYVDPANIHIYEMTPPDTYTYLFERVINNNNKYIVADAKQLVIKDIFSSYLETFGLFGRLDRSNAFELVNIKRQFGLEPGVALYPGLNVHPEGVTGGKLIPQDYQSCWYDDEYSKPFGAISCQYKDTNNEDALYTYYLSGYDEDTDINTYQVYSLANNEIIKHSTWTSAQIEAICEAIADNIEGVQYMPVDFVGRGLPYVEAGDTFEILTRSNDSITTIVLNRTITGEQTLTDSYKSV